MARFVDKFWLAILMAVMLASGTINTMVAKIQDMVTSDGNSYNHPYFQTATMFVGELMCLVFYFIAKLFAKKQPLEEEPLQIKIEVKSKSCKEKLGPMIFALPAVFDLTASTLMMIGLGLTAASVYQMLRGLIVVVVALYSVIFLRRRLFQHQIVGVVFVFIGVLLVGVASVIWSSSSSRNPILGAVLIIIGQFFAGGVFVVEEKFFGDIKVPALQAVGIEGLSGLTYFCILLPIFYAIPCYDKDMCAGSGHVENFPYAFKQLGADGLLMFLFFAYIFSISFFNWSGISVTKTTGALARSTIDTSRTVLVWAIDLAVGWEKFLGMQFAGFILLVFGTLLYNEAIVLPFWGFKESVANNKEYRRKLKETTENKLEGITPTEEEELRSQHESKEF
jgi:drug/metabolite transporter (DMT)-like permease